MSRRLPQQNGSFGRSLTRNRLWPPGVNRKRRMSGSIDMKALVYDGPREVHVKNVPDARIEQPTDVLVKITSTNICGSDLHMYEGRTDLEPGMVLGHENLGIVAEVGNAVVKVTAGDRVCLPFNIGCGFCRNCEEGLPRSA
ncbi:alcohol dehydrogenase catalytic domain-containing protein [Nocardia gipuzkoensis]|uniref:alcohol dehydrogenase catalytic domain-containing protein n=1 Tax=Nocardia gipuzkoensis TaxID=2749991 RepID=UPI00237D76AF|nr:alcohol dehydrogenase catalytic domain-containing protein [Nocardia gipuzkoensis]MDE1674601.1 alcohol dehydrogenase catalytic domain-containing protein [Nocardia gipuzkoensis]